MMTSFEMWSKREQLCLASAVSCSGDQNWLNVSRALKLLCGSIHSSEKFSQKPCAVKYGELLENFDTQKLKKCTSDNVASINGVTETPLDYILRRLTEERIQELKSEIRKEQEIFAKLYTDVVHLQTGNSNEEQIRAMWIEIEREEAFESNDKFRKRVSAQLGINKNWRQGNVQQFYYELRQQRQVNTVDQKQNTDTDKIYRQHGTSPLLSSLLKSSSPAQSTTISVTTSTPRVNAPTITNLLTGLIDTSSNHCILPYTSDISSVPVSKPISGFRSCEKDQNTLQSALSPSQSAPTLSMLLEKKKLPHEFHEPKKNLIGTELLDKQSAHCEGINVESIEDGLMTPTKDEEKQLMEVFKNLMPDNIDELADILTSSQEILNQEILEEGSILEEVESMIEETEGVDKEGIVLKPIEHNMEESREHQDDTNQIISMDCIRLEGKSIPKDEYQQISHDGCVENEISSSSNQVLVKNLKGKNYLPKQDVEEKIQLVENCEERIQKEEAKETAVLGDDEDEGTENIKINPPMSLESRKGSISDCSDIILIPTDDESNEDKFKKNTTENSLDPVTKEELLSKMEEENIKQNEIEFVISEKAISSTYLPDTGDDSSQLTTCKDNNSSSRFLPTKKNDSQSEEPSKEQLKPSLVTVRKLRDRDGSESPLVDDDKNENSTTQRLRRRYSSTHILDSFPNWFTSVDDREPKVSKKFLMAIYNNLLTNKNASIFLRPITDEQNELFKQVCRRPIDFQIIKRHIENGIIRNATDLQRDLFLMCQNVILTFGANSSYAVMAKDLMIDFVNLRDQTFDVNIEKMLSLTNSPHTAGVKVRGSSRKCHRIP